MRLRRAVAQARDLLDRVHGGAVEVAPYVETERVPEIEPEHYNGTNTMKLYVFGNDARAQAALIAVYDNLGKGASGAAVQNLDLMLGHPL